MSWFTAVLPVVTLILGAVGSFLADSERYRRARRDLVADTERSQRTAAYLAFVESCHEAAHKLGRMSVGCPEPLEADPTAFWLIDSDVARRLRNLQIVGGDDVIQAGQRLRDALLEFRTTVASRATYMGDDYLRAYRPVSAARDEFIRVCRAELQPTAR